MKSLGANQAIVYKSTGSWYTCKKNNGRFVQCRVKGKLKIKGLKSTNPIAVGDIVIIEPESNDNYMISDIEPRTNYIIRKSINLSKQTHIIGANVDQAVLLATLAAPETSTAFIDRFLVTAEAYHIPTILVFNKTDVYEAEHMEYLHAICNMYEQIGYKCLQVSAKDGTNVSAFTALLKDQITILSGHSGVGKSTLINKIDPNLELPTSEVSLSHLTGKHTTTFAEMYDLEIGGSIIDTPGIKSLGVVDMDKGQLAHRFPEMVKFMMDCHFHNCVHINEPKCAVKQAVEESYISAERYNNYLSIYHSDDEEKYRAK